MFNVAIFDRNVDEIQNIEKYLSAFLFSECEYTIYAFDNEDALLDFIDNSNINLNLISLDADSKSSLGFSAAEYIRKTDVKTNIIFITDDKNGLQLGYKYNAFDYILKPITSSKLIETIKRLFFYIDNSNSYFYIKIRGTIERFNEDSILYFASSGRKVTIFTNDNNVDFYAKMDEVFDQLDKNVFFRIHQSYIVNVRHIIKVTKNQVFMDNDEIIPISKKYCDILKNYFN